jgi:NADH/F420H2 dehydrogenase subunit C
MIIRKENLSEFVNIIPLISCRVVNNEIIFVTLKTNIILTLKTLKNHLNFRYKQLSCISGVDLYNYKYRFCVSYELLSLFFNSRLRVKVFLDESDSIFSSTSVFINADWWEREIWDLFGIFFENHKDLRRILTDYGFEGHPLRKDFPLSGYTEIFYDDIKKRIMSDRVQLTQDFRNFTFETSW